MPTRFPMTTVSHGHKPAPLLYDDSTVMYSSSSILKPLVTATVRFISPALSPAQRGRWQPARYPLYCGAGHRFLYRSSVKRPHHRYETAEYADYTNHCILRSGYGKIIVLAPFWLRSDRMLLNRYELAILLHKCSADTFS